MKLKHILVLVPVGFLLLGYGTSEQDTQLVSAAKVEEGPPASPSGPSPSVRDARFVTVAGVQVEVDPSLPFPIARPEQLGLVATGKATIEELIQKGGRNWYTATPFSDKPFAVPRELLRPEAFLPPPLGLLGSFGMSLADYSYPMPVINDGGVLVGLTNYENERKQVLATVNCANCHTGRVNGVIVPGIGNKFFDEGKTFQLVETLLQEGLRSSNPKTRAESEYYWGKFSEYRSLIFTGCNKNPRLGTHTGTRIEQVGSGHIHSLEQLTPGDSVEKYPCGGVVKVQPLNIIKFKNLAFSDGKMNSTWNSHWPIFTLLDKTDTVVDELAARPDIQALDAYAYFGTKSPSWTEVMGTPVDETKAAAGHKLFHAANACASCHGTYSAAGMLTSYKVEITPLEVVKTSPERTVGNIKEAQDGFYAKGPGPKFFKPIDEIGYLANPLCSTFLNYPYLHSAGVANLAELLTPEEQRSEEYYAGDFVDKERVGFATSFGAKLTELAKGKLLLAQKIPKVHRSGHSGPRFGTELSASDKESLLEYLKTLRCPEGP